MRLEVYVDTTKTPELQLWGFYLTSCHFYLHLAICICSGKLHLPRWSTRMRLATSCGPPFRCRIGSDNIYIITSFSCLFQMGSNYYV